MTSTESTTRRMLVPITGCGEVSEKSTGVPFGDSQNILIVNRWLSVRFNLISACVIGITGFVAVASPAINASLAGFALAFASTITNDVGIPFFTV